MTAPTRPRLWTYTAGGMGWIGEVRRSVVLGWDVAEPTVFALCINDPRTGTPVEWWMDRADAARGVDGVVGDWMWQCSRGGVPHVAIRPLFATEPLLIPEALLGRFLATTEFWASPTAPGFDVEVAALLGGAS